MQFLFDNTDKRRKIVPELLQIVIIIISPFTELFLL